MKNAFVLLLLAGCFAASCGDTVHLNEDGEGGDENAAGAKFDGSSGDSGASGDFSASGGSDAMSVAGSGDEVPGGAPGEGGTTTSSPGGAAAGIAGAEVGGGPGGDPTHPSCIGETGATEELCSTITVAGGPFKRSFDGVYNLDESLPATVSSFELDKYEVSVGRYRVFLGSGWSNQENAPPAGSGAHPKIPGSGWKAAWNGQLGADSSAAEAAQQCDDRTSLREDYGLELYPIPCVTWYEAFAFCAWSGGRLPTWTEWNYAAAGGSDQRVYPWSDPAKSIDIADVHAVYKWNVPTTGNLSPFLEVNTKPAGVGLYGHFNLAGNLAEWVFDQEGPPPVPCEDCARFDVGNGRLAAGGGFASDAAGVTTSARWGSPPSTRSILTGFRCAFEL